MGTILVTGGAGFIGARLVRRLVEQGQPVALLIRPNTDLPRIRDLLPRVRLAAADLTDRNALEGIVRKMEPVGVFHLATANMQSGVAGPDEELVRTNVMGTVNLLAALQHTNYHFFVNTGSFLEYGLPERPAREADRCEPIELQSVTKLAAALHCQAVARRDKKPIVTLRVFSPYGPGMQRGRLLEAMISRALRNEDIPMTEPRISRDFIFVDDIVDLYLEAMERAGELRGEMFNAGTGVKTTLAELAELVLRMTGSRSKLQWHALPRVSYDSPHWEADMAKTFAQFTWRPKHSLETGLRETITWVRAQQAAAP